MDDRSPYELAMELIENDIVEDVRVDSSRITVVYLPQEEVQMQHHIPESKQEELFMCIDNVIEHTFFQYEYGRGAMSVNSLSGGIHHNPIAGGNPEFQIQLVK